MFQGKFSGFDAESGAKFGVWCETGVCSVDFGVNPANLGVSQVDFGESRGNFGLIRVEFVVALGLNLGILVKWECPEGILGCPE